MILLKSRSFTEAAPRWHDDQIVKLDFLDVLLISQQPTAVALDSIEVVQYVLVILTYVLLA